MMMKKILLLSGILLSAEVFAQTVYTMQDTGAAYNSATKILESSNQQRVTIGGYAQIDYNQQIGSDVMHNGNLDVHRLILLFGYKFSDKTSFVTELEIEHVNEFFVEQAFLNHAVNPKLNLRAGLMLVPMGIVNEYHEPTTYNGVERPNMDAAIVPTTWREMGIGITGKFDDISLRYQAYLFNGFNGYSVQDDGSAEAHFRGKDGYRAGRQKGANATFSYPNFSGKLDYYGILGLKIGLSSYYGKSQTDLKEGVDPNDPIAVATLDSSSVTVVMTGLDFRYQKKGFTARGQFIYADNKNAAAYNLKGNTDLGSAMMGYYLEAGYNVFKIMKLKTTQKMNVFVRYETYDTHFKVYDESIKRGTYNRTEITTGLSYHIADGAVVKVDYQRLMNETAGPTQGKDQFNAGVGWWF